MMKLKSILEQQKPKYRTYNDAVKGELWHGGENYSQIQNITNDFDRNIARLNKIRDIKNNPGKYGFKNVTAKEYREFDILKANQIKKLEKEFPEQYKQYSTDRANKLIAASDSDPDINIGFSDPAVIKKLTGMDTDRAIKIANKRATDYNTYHDTLSDTEKETAKAKLPGYADKSALGENIMKNSRKQLIEEYVNLRCKRLQEDASIDENWLGDAWDSVKSAGGKALDYGKKAATKVLDSGAGYLIPGMQGVQAAYSMANAKDPKTGKWSMGAMANKGLDQLQTGLDIAGMIPGLGIIPDAANVVIGGGRGAVASAMGDHDAAKKHYTGMGLSLAAAVPGAGLAAGAGKLGSKAFKAYGKTGQAIDKATDISKWAGKPGGTGEKVMNAMSTAKYGGMPKAWGGKATAKKMGGGIPWLTTKVAAKADKHATGGENVRTVASLPFTAPKTAYEVGKDVVNKVKNIELPSQEDFMRGTTGYTGPIGT